MCVDSPPSTCMGRTSTCLGRGGMSPTSPGSRLAIDTRVNPNVLYNFYGTFITFKYVFRYVFRISSIRCHALFFLFFLLGFVRVLFKGGVCYIRKPVDINDSWIRLDGVISMCSPSV